MFSGVTIVYFMIALVISLSIALIVNIVVKRSQTLPIVQPFYGGAINGTSNLVCGRMSSEAEKLYSMFLIKNVKNSEQGKDDIRELKMLLSKLCCFKQDLMSPQQTISAVKELGFVTHQDIQPIGDLTGRCFSKTIPERDLSLQIKKWRNIGTELIYRLCTQANLTEGQVKRAEKLFATVLSDVEDVAISKCINTVPKEVKSRFDPDPSMTDNVQSLKNYDGLY